MEWLTGLQVEICAHRELLLAASIIYKSYFAKVGGGLGGWVFSRVGGSKALDAHPSYNSEGFLGWAPATPSFFGHRSLVWLFAGALFCFVVVQLAIFQMADLFFYSILNLWNGCCTKLSEVVRSPVVKIHGCSSSDPWFKL